MTENTVELRGDNAEIMRLHREFVDANNPLDSSWLRQHASAVPNELVWFNLNGATYVGQDHIAQLWDALSTAMKEDALSSEVHDEHIEVDGDVAWVTYLSRYQADFGELGSYDGGMRSTEIWRRRNGEWKLVHGHFSTPT
ncbi:YybH family protein [Mycobacterium vicinigordonae]|uniref:Nuclear transport factor 2 family protein n=1 Tax=Mycobacterium vicinigordonae TaxID=1719132 RepID=A0A7D6E4V7_9MYCO|nr:nuclear transport factor 2 family protein [Mycobacterium vicinigordonae]QLL09226.1 nuclear transport factor 2 family protein [Mycobacterium vicinigordonae]